MTPLFISFAMYVDRSQKGIDLFILLAYNIEHVLGPAGKERAE